MERPRFDFGTGDSDDEDDIDDDNDGGDLPKDKDRKVKILTVKEKQERRQKREEDKTKDRLEVMTMFDLKLAELDMEHENTLNELTRDWENKINRIEGAARESHEEALDAALKEQLAMQEQRQEQAERLWYGDLVWPVIEVFPTFSRPFSIKTLPALISGEDSRGWTLNPKPFPPSFQERIVEAEIFVALFSGHYLEDEVCKREVMTAYRLGKKIVPVVIDAMPGMYRCPAPGVPLSGGDVSTLINPPFSPLDSSYILFAFALGLNHAESFLLSSVGHMSLALVPQSPPSVFLSRSTHHHTLLDLLGYDVALVNHTLLHFFCGFLLVPKSIDSINPMHVILNTETHNPQSDMVASKG